LCKNIQKIYYKRNQTVYKIGNPNSSVFIIKKGEFELETPLKKNYSLTTQKIINIFGKSS
jgi:hypothetical protein